MAINRGYGKIRIVSEQANTSHRGQAIASERKKTNKASNLLSLLGQAKAAGVSVTTMRRHLQLEVNKVGSQQPHHFSQFMQKYGGPVVAHRSWWP